MKYDWDREIAAAAGWIAEQVKLAIDRAFPPDGLWGGTGASLKSDENMRTFREVLAIEIGATFERKGLIWEPGEPLKGSMLRVVGVDGRFPDPEIIHAMRAIGADEAIEHLPPGMSVQINPARLVVRESNREALRGLDVSHWQGANTGV